MYGDDNLVASGSDQILDEAELMELGLSHELISDELYLPSHPSRDWIRCYISTTGPGCYRMYLEGKKRVRFLLSAKRFEGKDSTFYISSNEDFPGFEYLPSRGYIARLERQTDKSFMLALNQCHLCDKLLGHFHCGRGDMEKEVIARITHYFKLYRPCNAEYRYFNIQIPFISKFGKRKIWCPRAFRRSNSKLANDVSVNEAIIRDKKCSIVLKSKPPSWNPELQSLIVKFQGNRVLIPSVKNFLLFVSSESSVSHATSDDEIEDEMELSATDDEQRHSTYSGSTAGHSISNSISSVTEIPRIISSLRYRSDSSIESPMRKSSRGKSINSKSPIIGSPYIEQSKGHHESRSNATSLTETTITCSSIENIVDSKSSAASVEADESIRYASMYQYVFPPSTDYQDSYVKSEISIQKQHLSAITPRSATAPIPIPIPIPIPVGSKQEDGESLKSLVSPMLTTLSQSRDSHHTDQLKKLRQAYAEKYALLNDENEAFFQFGKASPTRFILDFKFPFSPLQAFGVALSVFVDDIQISPNNTASPYISQSRKTMR